MKISQRTLMKNDDFHLMCLADELDERREMACVTQTLNKDLSKYPVMRRGVIVANIQKVGSGAPMRPAWSLPKTSKCLAQTNVAGGREKTSQKRHATQVPQ